jgi:hypothetical protein
MVLRLPQPNLWQATRLLQGESGLGIGETHCLGLSKIRAITHFTDEKQL